MIPLRIIITDKCYGKCNFCHSEGNNSLREMNEEFLREIIVAANELSIPKITFTGGEPLLFNNLRDVIRTLYSIKNESICFGLTTSGYSLEKNIDMINEYFSYISCSINSLGNWNQFSRVNPYKLIPVLENIKVKKSINTVVTHERIHIIDELISICRTTTSSLKIMVPIPVNEESRHSELMIINHFLQKNKKIEIVCKQNQVFGFVNDNHVNIKLRLPIFSKIQYFKTCNKCRYFNLCGEYVCAIRIYPNKTISPCLNNHIIRHVNSDLTKHLEEIYKILK